MYGEKKPIFNNCALLFLKATCIFCLTQNNFLLKITFPLLTSTSWEWLAERCLEFLQFPELEEELGAPRGCPVEQEPPLGTGGEIKGERAPSEGQS